MRTILLTGLVVACCLSCASLASARGVESWPYDRLFKEADLVVIATAVSSEPSDDRDNDNPWRIEFRGINTSFKVNSVIRGMAGDKIKVLHFVLPSEVVPANGPSLVTFRSESATLDITVDNVRMKVSTGVPEYMLFLKATEDGRYEPVSGRIDPDLSIRELNQSLNWLTNSE